MDSKRDEFREQALLEERKLREQMILERLEFDAQARQRDLQEDRVRGHARELQRHSLRELEREREHLEKELQELKLEKERQEKQRKEDKD